MASVDTLISPPDGSAVLPTVEFSTCNPQLLQAQISVIYLANDGYPLTNWEDPAEWASRINNSSADANAIRELIVIGSIAAPSQTEKKISGGRKIFSPAEYTLTGRIDDNSDTNYDFMRGTGCNRQYRMWYGTLGAKLYGGNTGILVNFRGWEEIVEDDLEYATLNFEVKWTSRLSPLRITNPIA
ncbi:MAG: hypothetical protein E6Q97_27840 [Desulfurellales bacterium]|nr:MAG: hypothetical protein E6Q97_27840 [Desulfurellales bacterium]